MGEDMNRDLAIARAVDQHYQWRNAPLMPEVIEAIIANVGRALADKAINASRDLASVRLDGPIEPSGVSGTDTPSAYPNPAQVVEPPKISDAWWRYHETAKACDHGIPYCVDCSNLWIEQTEIAEHARAVAIIRALLEWDDGRSKAGCVRQSNALRVARAYCEEKP
jgi:hypothetical protein